MDEPVKFEPRLWKSRVFWVGITLLLIALVLCARIITLTNGRDNQEKAALMVMVRPPSSVIMLEQHAAHLKQMTENIESASLREITQPLDDTVRLIELANLELDAQHKAWLRVKDTARSDGNSFVELKRQLAATQALQDNEVKRIQTIMDESQNKGFVNFAFEQTTAFVLGVITSILSTAMYRPAMNLFISIKHRFTAQKEI